MLANKDKKQAVKIFKCDKFSLRSPVKLAHVSLAANACEKLYKYLGLLKMKKSRNPYTLARVSSLAS